MNIGLFWISNMRLVLEGEGIGRFGLRLVDGLLQKDGVNIIVVTEHFNMPVVEQLFAPIKAQYPQRLILVAAVHTEWVNRKLPVDIWLVPYVGTPSALGLAKPIVVCLHDLYYIHFPEAPLNAWDAYVDQIARLLAQKAAAFTFNSEYIRDNEGLQYLQLPKERTRVIRLSPPTEEYSYFGVLDERTFRSYYQLHTPYLIYPSQIRPYKNHARLVEAFLAFKQTEAGRSSPIILLLTATVQNSPQMQAILAAINACPDAQAQQSIHFMRNRLPANHLPSLYRYAAGTVVPTLLEGSCPFPILESLSQNTPAAFSDIPVAREVIRDMRDFITFDPCSVPDIARAISELVAGKADVAKQKEALQTLLNRTWKDIADEYYSLFSDILSGC